MTLGERLLQYRTNLKMSQDILAEKLNVTRQTISKWETDQSTPEFNKILPLCELFGISADELIRGEKLEEGTKKEEESTLNSYNEYLEKRNKKKALIVSSAVFLYIIGTFCPAFIQESNIENELAGVIVMVALWAIATTMLIYFFISYPIQKEEKEAKKKEKDSEYEISRRIERRILEVIALLFLLIYLLVSFITMAWYITWILWLVLPIVEVIVKIIFDLKREKKKEEN